MGLPVQFHHSRARHLPPGIATHPRRMRGEGVVGRAASPVPTPRGDSHHGPPYWTIVSNYYTHLTRSREEREGDYAARQPNFAASRPSREVAITHMHPGPTRYGEMLHYCIDSQYPVHSREMITDRVSPDLDSRASRRHTRASPRTALLWGRGFRASCGEGASALPCPHPQGDAHHGPQHGVKRGNGVFHENMRCNGPTGLRGIE